MRRWHALRDLVGFAQFHQFKRIPARPGLERQVARQELLASGAAHWAMLLKPCWRELLPTAWRAHTPPGSLGGHSVRCLGAALSRCCARALRIGPATVLRRRVLGVGGLVYTGSLATCGLTKRLVVRVAIVGRPIARTLPPPAPRCQGGMLPDGRELLADAWFNLSRATLQSARLSKPRTTISGCAPGQASSICSRAWVVKLNLPGHFAPALLPQHFGQSLTKEDVGAHPVAVAQRQRGVHGSRGVLEPRTGRKFRVSKTLHTIVSPLKCLSKNRSVRGDRKDYNLKA